MIRWTKEAEIGQPYWWDALEEVPLADMLPDSCDLLVIGGGYTGLSAAIAAHDCGARIVVVDAGEPGKGASTRNGGMVGAHPRLGWDRLKRDYGADTADALFAEAAPALDWAREFIRHEEIACDLQETGRIQLAWTKPHFESQKRLVRHLQDKTAVRVRLVERDDLAAEIVTERYFGGFVLEQHCGLHPARYHQGMLRAALRRGIPVLAQARVGRLERDGAGFVAQTARGNIRAGKVLLATNGYTGKPFGAYARRVFPLPSFLIATEELPATLIDEIAPGRRMMVETRARHSYYRVSPDGKRILFGGRAAMVDVDLTKAAARLRAMMCSIWPQLEETRLSHVWTGYTGFSFAQMPNVGEDRGLHHAMGYSGSGTVLAPYLGAKAAWQAMGDPRGETAYCETRLPANPVHPGGRPHFLKAVDLWYRTWIDGWENRRAR